MFNRDKNKSALNHVNKGKSDAIKVLVFMLVLMMAGGGLLWYISSVMGNAQERRNFERPQDEVVDAVETAQPDRAVTANDTEIVMGEYGEIILDPETGHVIAAMGGISYHRQLGGRLELPIYGATGWAGVRTALRQHPNATAATVLTLDPGEGFTIVREQGSWWYVEVDKTTTGWVDMRACLINLPDVIPSIVYNIPSVTGSLARSSGYDIPGVTGLPSTNAWAYNPRFGREMYIVPAKYALALDLFRAQQTALENGNTIIMYEAFRPRQTQQRAVDGMRELMEHSYVARTNINNSGWSLTWFVSTGLSNHQRGAAIDISIGTVRNYEYRRVGDFIYRHILEHRAHIMPSRMHELSPWAAIFDAPRTATLAQIINGTVPLTENARLPGVEALHQAIAGAGTAFTPLASEWWHFNHTASITSANAMGMRGEFFVETVYSWAPEMHAVD